MKILLLGAGGMGMLPLAIYLKQMGHHPLAYDDAFSEPALGILRALDIPCVDGLEPEDKVDRVVYSSAIAHDHPLYRKALAYGLPLYRRGIFWAEIIQSKKLLAIVGSHGKTTTTAMLIDLLSKSGMTFDYMLGGLFKDKRLPAAYRPESEWIVSEIDESDATIQAFSPAITVVVNFDWDHVDTYPQSADLEASFLALLQRTTEKIIFLAEDQALRPLAELSQKPCEALQFGPSSPYHIEASTGGNFRLSSGSSSLELPGLFNIKNASLALAAATALGVTVDKEPLKDWQGVWRRQDHLYQDSAVHIMADYAHHPQELRALLALARSSMPGPQTVVFQPHRYTRTRQYAQAFAEALSAADAVLLLPVYAANEAFLPDGTSLAIKNAFPEGSKLQYFEDKAACLAYLKILQPKGALLFVGAGDIDQLAHAYVQTLSLPC